MSTQESLLVTNEVETMLKKGGIQKISIKEGIFLSKLFFVSKKMGQQIGKKLRKSECLHSLSSLESGGLALHQEFVVKKITCSK